MPDSPAPHRVLVVDDEPNLAEVVTMALRFQGFTVETAGTGREALAAVAKFKPHLMVLDVMLPDMEGFEVATRLGAQRAAVPIIFLTARDATQTNKVALAGRALRGSRTGRPVMVLLDLLSRRWALRVLWELRDEGGPSFRELQARCGHISSSVLNERLRELRDAGIVGRAGWPRLPPHRRRAKPP